MFGFVCPVSVLSCQWQVFSAPGSGASRGVSILIAKRISFKLLKQKVDENGRYIILSGFLQNEKCTLVNVYAPNTGQNTFLYKLNLVLSEFACDPILLGGDLNLVSDALLDRSGRTLLSDGALSNALTEVQNSLALADIWHVVDKKEYTFNFPRS